MTPLAIVVSPVSTVPAMFVAWLCSWLTAPWTTAADLGLPQPERLRQPPLDGAEARAGAR